MKYLVLLSFIISFTLNCNSNEQQDKVKNFQSFEYTFQQKYLTLYDSLKISYVDEGQGSKVILFVHGLGSYIPAWQKNIQKLKTNYRCIALDLPGYGNSSKKDLPISMSYFVDVLEQFRQKLNIPTFYLAGHSMGGQVAMAYALKYPANIEKLILISPAGIEKFTDKEKQWFQMVFTKEVVKATSDDQIAKNLENNFFKMPADARFMINDRINQKQADEFDDYAADVVKSVMAMLNAPLSDDLSQLKIPTLLVFGEKDQLIPNPYLHKGTITDIAHQAETLIPNSRLLLLPECGHFAMFEKADSVNSEIKNFLTD